MNMYTSKISCKVTHTNKNNHGGLEYAQVVRTPQNNVLFILFMSHIHYLIIKFS
jgi:hypothetical protein